MEKKAIAMIGVGTTIAALIVLSGVAYATSGSFIGQNARNGTMMEHYGSGSAMMGRAAGYSGGMMGDNSDSNWSCSCTGRCPASAFHP